MQAEELRELMGIDTEPQQEESIDTESQLKEVYDDISRQERLMKDELDFYKNQDIEIKSLLDSYGIPGAANNKILSLVERLNYAFQIMYATA